MRAALLRRLQPALTARLCNARSARKILNARLFPNKDTGRAWDKCVTDEGGEVLCVSQARVLERSAALNTQAR